ncbi:MAG: glycosyltransferase, partial [Muribaculaceae bacterium]|nr:glycosyltransferase [Muribaculaceae bacterium]
GVQVIYVPCYLNGDDGIFDMQYYDMLAGMDATAFPSYYEPWGYTPLESVAYGVPTVTTSLSGFGQWVLSTSASDFEQSGVVVIPRTDSNYGEVVEKLAASLRQLADADADTRDKVSKAARSNADKALWDYFIVYYVDAFKKALDAASARE